MRKFADAVFREQPSQEFCRTVSPTEYPTEYPAAIESFADGFGKSYRDEQLKGLDNTLNILVERKKILDAEFPKKKRVNTTLCISAALALIILML